MQTVYIRLAGPYQSPEDLAELRRLVAAVNYMAVRDGENPLVLVKVWEPPAP